MMNKKKINILNLIMMNKKKFNILIGVMMNTIRDNNIELFFINRVSLLRSVSTAPYWHFEMYRPTISLCFVGE